MKLAKYALAATIITTPVLAQEKECAIIKVDNQWSVFTIHQKADTVNSKFCLSFESDDPRVKGIEIKANNGTDVMSLAKENCLDMKGLVTQTLTPVITASDGDAISLPPLGMEQAMDVYTKMSQECLRPKGQPVSFSKLDI